MLHEPEQKNPRVLQKTLLANLIVFAALVSLLLTFTSTASAYRDVQVTFRNYTDEDAAVQWWGDKCIESCPNPSIKKLPKGSSITIRSSVDVLNRWDIVGFVGVWYDADKLWGPCFAGRNPSIGKPRFSMSEKMMIQSSSGKSNWKICNTNTGEGAFDKTFEEDVTKVFFYGARYTYPDVSYGTMLVHRAKDTDYIRFEVKIIDLPEPPKKTMRVTINDPVGGRVESLTPGIECGLKCEAKFTRGVRIQMIAKPNPGYYLESWGGECSGKDDDCIVFTNKDTQVNATFLPIPPDPLSVTLAGTGQGRITGDKNQFACNTQTPTCTTSLPHGSSILLRAYNDKESIFEGWSGACNGKSDTCLVSMLEAKSVIATFTLRPTVTLDVSIGGIGEVKGQNIQCRVPEAPEAPNTCSRSFERGTTIVLTAKSLGEAVFQGWGGTGGCGNTNPCTITLNHDYHPSAQFATPAKPQMIRVIKTGEGSGRVTGPRIDCGETCSVEYFGAPLVGLTFTATPDAGSTFDHWEGVCSRSGKQATCQTLTTGTVKAVFSAIPSPPKTSLTIKTAGDGNGKVSSSPTGIACLPQCVNSFTTGQTINLEATPNSGSEFSGWSGACEGKQKTCRVRLDASRLVIAIFSRTPFIDPIIPPVDPIPPAPVIAEVEANIGEQSYENLLGTTPPTLTGLRLSRRVLYQGGSSVVRYSLNQNAEVRMVFKRKGSKKAQYTYRLRPGKSGGDTGINNVRILTRINNRNVRPGKWVMSITAISPNGKSASLNRVLVLK